VCGAFTFILGLWGVCLGSSLLRQTEYNLVTSVLGYRADATTHYIPLVRIPTKDHKLAFYWVWVQNRGTKPQHNVRLIFDNVGPIQAINSNKNLRLKTLTGEMLEDLRSLEGEDALKVTIESLPPQA